MGSQQEPRCEPVLGGWGAGGAPSPPTTAPSRWASTRGPCRGEVRCCVHTCPSSPWKLIPEAPCETLTGTPHSLWWLNLHTQEARSWPRGRVALFRLISLFTCEAARADGPRRLGVSCHRVRVAAPRATVSSAGPAQRMGRMEDGLLCPSPPEAWDSGQLGDNGDGLMETSGIASLGVRTPRDDSEAAAPLEPCGGGQGWFTMYLPHWGVPERPR